MSKVRKRSPSRQKERIAFARDQRKKQNEFADDVWQMVRGSRIQGVKFRREHAIGIYTVDFVSLEIKLVIEVDGKEHFTGQGRKRDEIRDEFLRGEGFEVLRIEGFRVTQDQFAVRNEIEKAVIARRDELA